MTDTAESKPGDEVASLSLSTIYQARKSGDRSVNILKQQFQSQIERAVHNRPQDHHRGPRPRPQVTISGQQLPQQHQHHQQQQVGKEIRRLNREKSFDEARTAVQSQIERIFQKAAAAKKNEKAAGIASSTPGDSPSTGLAQVRYAKHSEIPVVSPLPVNQNITLKVREDASRL